jgi:hypothetical protein
LDLYIRETCEIALHNPLRRELTPSHHVKFAHMSFQIIDIRWHPGATSVTHDAYYVPQYRVGIGEIRNGPKGIPDGL